MTDKSIAVFGVYSSDLDAERGAADLISAGFPSPDISVLLPDMRSKRELAHAGHAGAAGLLNGALGILSGGNAQVIAGVGLVVAAGPITARLEGIGPATGDGLSGALVDWGIPSNEAKSYEGRIQSGATLLAVHCESPARAKRAKQVLNSSGADDVAANGR
jgi:rhodanese-related sulfurtransferase